MLRSETDFIQTMRDFFRFVQVRLSDGRHADNSVHRRTDIVRHRGEKDSSGLIAFLRLLQGVGQILTHVMLSRRFVQDGEILIAVNGNEINLNPALKLVFSTGLIFITQPLGQLAVEKRMTGRILRRHPAAQKQTFRMVNGFFCFNVE